MELELNDSSINQNSMIISSEVSGPFGAGTQHLFQWLGFSNNLFQKFQVLAKLKLNNFFNSWNFAAISSEISIPLGAET